MLYSVLLERIERFITINKLKEMAHELNTNMNESFNMICTWFAPKNKVFATSGSLHNRIAFAVGINSLGLLEFYKKLFRKMGITMTPNVLHYLKLKGNIRFNKLAKKKTGDAKKTKNKRKYEKLKEHTRVAKIELHKRQGTYRKGMNIDDPYNELVNATQQANNNEGDVDEDGERKPPAKRSRVKSSGFCEYCGKSDHLTKRSKKCKAALDSAKKYRREDGTLLTEPPSAVVVDCPPREFVPVSDQDLQALLLDAASEPPVVEVDDDDAVVDCDRFDSLPFDTFANHDSDEGSLDFHDAQAWDTDAEDDDEEVKTVCMDRVI